MPNGTRVESRLLYGSGKETGEATAETEASSSITPKIINYFRSGQFFNKDLSVLRKTNELEPP